MANDDHAVFYLHKVTSLGELVKNIVLFTDVCSQESEESMYLNDLTRAFADSIL